MVFFLIFYVFFVLFSVNTTPILVGAVSIEDEENGGFFFEYIQSGVVIPSDHPIWVNPADAGENFEIDGDMEVATIIPPMSSGNAWAMDHEAIGEMTMRPFICQYPIM